MRRTGIQTVAIIGGGPGGAQCALRLAEAGLRVTVFEPRSHFEKACGGGIPGRGLERFPFLDDTALPAKSIRECLIVSPSGREARVPLADPLYVFSRADLHSFLLARAVSAGAAWERARVMSADSEASAWTLRAASSGEDPHPFGPFDFLVAADGASGGARRRLLPGNGAPGTSQGIGYYRPEVSEEFITLKFYPRLHGYLWVFPRPDHSSAGICGTLGDPPAAALKKLMDDFLKERYPAPALAGAVRYAALIPAAPRDPLSERLQGDGWALVGDAARLVDPLTREGIYYAMLSGDLLAEALIAGRPEDYTASWARQGAFELSWAAAHGGPFFDRRFIERMVFLCAASPSIARVLSDLIAGRQSYRTLKRRLILLSPRVGAQLIGRVAGSSFRPARGN
jgi:geranylgeranyl diphosphate/geranylgeranyl-bacteriochlorophyllide a reductase